MKWLIAIPVVIILGLGGIMLTHERGGGPSSPGSQGKIVTISTGEAVDLAPHLRDGTWTVVEFTADW
jgi:hypothetical protein